MGIQATLIANPVAGADEAQDRAAHLRDRLSDTYDVRIVLTAGAGDAHRAAAEAARDGCEYLFVAGGDGTLNEAVNGLGSVQGALERIAVGIIPLGTGNDFATAIGIPSDADEAVAALMAGTPHPVDVGDVNGRLFVNVSAGGFLAEVSDAVDPALKSVAGRLAYLLGGAKVFLQSEPFQCRTVTGDHECLLFAVCNAPTIGGGRLIAPDAVVDDGQLDVCLVEAMDPVRFLALLRKVAEGTHTDVTGVQYFRAAALSLDFDRTVAVNVDGEVFRADRCEYRVLPAAARFLMPSVAP
jgi:diacylglycerol kinase (ATP)